MNKIYLAVIAVTFSCFIISGCATFPESKEPVQKSNLTAGVAKKEIIKGKTTQAEIMQLFGSPNIITKNRDNNEVWNYTKQSFDTKVGADGGTLILWSGSRAMSSAMTKSFDLIIEFDKDDVVKDYSMISASF